MTLAATPVSPLAIARCVDVLASGALAILPTDTVYGVCADALNDVAVRAIHSAKGRGSEMPLQLLFGRDLRLIAEFAQVGPAAERALAGLGPGPWTLVLPAAESWDSPLLAGGRTVGIRIPGSQVIADVVLGLGRPLAASSANRHGQPSPTTCSAAISEIGEQCAIALDGGTTAAEIDSTVIDLSSQDQPRILREGAIDRDTVADILGLRDIPVLRSVRP